MFVTVSSPASVASFVWEGDAGCQAVSEWGCDLVPDGRAQLWGLHVRFGSRQTRHSCSENVVIFSCKSMKIICCTVE